MDYQVKKHRPRIAVIGDSCIEAFNINIDESYPYLLKKKFQEKYDIYAFGSGGAPLSEYLNISRYVDKYFDPDIIIFNLEYNDFDESILKYNQYFRKIFLTLSVNGPQVTENKPKLDKSYAEFVFWKRFLRSHSALGRYIIFNLKLRVLYWGLVKKEFQGNVKFDASSTEQRKEVELATRYLVEKIKVENVGRKIIFVMAAQRDGIYNSNIVNLRSSWSYSLMKDLCRENSLNFLDLTEPFKNDYTKNLLKFNLNIDEHWNKYGHKITADAVYNFLINKCSL